MKNKVCTACLGKRQHSIYGGSSRSGDFPGDKGGSTHSVDNIKMVDCKRCNGTGEEPKPNWDDGLKQENKKERCIRTGYDLYECPCDECVDLDIQRQGNVKDTGGLLKAVETYGKMKEYDDRMVVYIYNVVMFNDQRRDTTPEEMIEYPCRIGHIYKRIDQNMNRIDVKYGQRERDMEEHRKLIVGIYYMFVGRHERKLEAQDPTSIHFIYNMIYDHENSKE